jgi:predicted nucleic acid-binding protein
VRRYLLDTAPIAALLRNRPAAVTLISPWLVHHEAATSIIVYAEVVEYIKSFPDFQRRRTDLQILLREIAPYRLSYAILERYADLRRQLRPPHGPGLIGDVDTLIAATALERNLTLVTGDSDFQRVPGLAVQLLTSLR